MSKATRHKVKLKNRRKKEGRGAGGREGTSDIL